MTEIKWKVTRELTQEIDLYESDGHIENEDHAIDVAQQIGDWETVEATYAAEKFERIK